MHSEPRRLRSAWEAVAGASSLQCGGTQAGWPWIVHRGVDGAALGDGVGGDELGQAAGHAVELVEVGGCRRRDQARVGGPPPSSSCRQAGTRVSGLLHAVPSPSATMLSPVLPTGPPPADSSPTSPLRNALAELRARSTKARPTLSANLKRKAERAKAPSTCAPPGARYPPFHDSDLRGSGRRAGCGGTARAGNPQRANRVVAPGLTLPGPEGREAGGRQSGVARCVAQTGGRPAAPGAACCTLPVQQHREPKRMRCGKAPSPRGQRTTVLPGHCAALRARPHQPTPEGQGGDGS